jgi:hypothetical protein
MTATYIIQAFAGMWPEAVGETHGTALGVPRKWQEAPDEFLATEIARARDLGFERTCLFDPAGIYKGNECGLNQWTSTTPAQKAAIRNHRASIHEVYGGFLIHPEQTSRGKGGWPAEEMPRMEIPTPGNQRHYTLIREAMKPWGDLGIRRIWGDYTGGEIHKQGAMMIQAMATMTRVEYGVEAIPLLPDLKPDWEWLKLQPAMCLWEYAKWFGLWTMRVPAGVEVTIWCYEDMTVEQMRTAKANGWQLAALGWGFQPEQMRELVRIQTGKAEGDE